MPTAEETIGSIWSELAGDSYRVRFLEPEELTREPEEKCFPLVLAAQAGAGSDSLSSLAKNEKFSARESLRRFGAVLFRDFGVKGAREFEDFLRALDLRP